MPEDAANLGLALQPDPSRLTLPRFLDDVAARHGPRVALRHAGRDLRYAELRSEARAVARGLVGAGVEPGAHLALLFANRPEWAVACFGAALAGARVVPVSTFATAAEREHVLAHSDASVLLMQRGLRGRDFAEETARALPALPRLRRVLCWGIERALGAVEPWAELERASGSASDAQLDEIAAQISPGDPGFLIYTSGTTARPKGVLHRQRAAVIQSWRFAELMGLTPEDRAFTAQPFFWTAGFAMSLGATLAAGATLLTQEMFEPGEALALIERERVTTVHAWPHQEKSMAEHPDAARRDLSCVRRVEHSSPLARLVPLARDEWGMYGSYGTTETFTLATAFPASAPAELRHRSHGPPLPGNELRIVDPASGTPLPSGEHGEIAVKGPTLMLGYWKVPQEETFDADGFYRTGDAGWLDGEGRLHWRGRLSGMIKTGGANVSPLEVEEAMSAYPGVKSAHALGVPHPTLGEAVVLCVVQVDGAAPIDAEAVRAFLRPRLAPYKLPRAVLSFAPDDVAFTGSQKIALGPLRECALARLAADRVEIAGHVYKETQEGV